MSLYLLIFIAYIIWTLIGIVHFIRSLGRKTGPNTLSDKIFYPAVLQFALLLGSIHYIIEKIERKK